MYIVQDDSWFFFIHMAGMRTWVHGRIHVFCRNAAPIQVLKYKKKKIEKSNFQAYRISVDKSGGHLNKNIAFNITKTFSNRGLSK